MTTSLPPFLAWEKLPLPVVVAPMFLVSLPPLVLACTKAGVPCAMPALNGRTLADFQKLLSTIEDGWQALDPQTRAPYGINLIVHKSNPRLEQDLAYVVERKVPFVITSLGSPAEVVRQVHSYGGRVFHDVATVEHAKKAAQAGVDGLILVCGGAGGHAGVLSPFAFVPAVRRFFSGTILVAGAITEGTAVKAVKALGGDLAYMGTRFIATQEAQAPQGYKQMLVDANAGAIVHTPAVSGVPANFLRPSLEAAGYKLEGDHPRRPLDMEGEAKAWKDVWSAGHGVELIDKVLTVAEVVADLKAGYSR